MRFTVAQVAQVVDGKIDGKDFYRLILTGFKDKSGVKELQLFLSENGIGSEVSTK